MSTIACNGEVKGNAKCKILVLSHPLGDLGATHRVHLRLDGKCIVDFLLGIIELSFDSSHGCGTIKKNLSKSAFYRRVGQFECKF